jgi:diadenosine tetraphosphate (Ap4A) HIT family hydrolase
MMTAGCCVCSQIDGRADGDLIARLLPGRPYVRRVLVESRSFAAIPSLGPLVPGHSLLCPKAHVRSLASLYPSGHAEFDVVCAGVGARLRALHGGELHRFEHGSATVGDRVLCTVDHAHLHLLPLPTGTRLDLGPGWLPFDGSLGALPELCGGAEYLAYWAPDGSAQVLPARRRAVGSQYLRRAAAAALGRPAEWNWRENPEAEAADRSWRQYCAP